MMHTFRLLDMAIEILSTGHIHVKRPNREELLRIRRGEASYDDLMEKAEQKMKEVNMAYKNSQLQSLPDAKMVEDLLVSLRKAYYQNDHRLSS